MAGGGVGRLGTVMAGSPSVIRPRTAVAWGAASAARIVTTTRTASPPPGRDGAALAWMTPVSGVRCLALAAHVRALPDWELHELLGALPRERFDRLVEAAYRPEGTAA